MPRNSSGVYSLPAGNPVVSGTIIDEQWANPTMTDLGSEITGSLPRNGSAPMTGPLILARDAILDKEAVTLEQMLNVQGGTSGNYLPAGAMQAFAMNAVPTGWLECNGAAISRTTYAELFAVIGVTYGVGNATTTFNLPDLRGTFLRGWDHGRGIDGGRAFGSDQSPDNAAHSHSVSDPSHVHPGGTGTHSHTVNDPGHIHGLYDGVANPSGAMYGPVRADAYSYPPGQKLETDATPGAMTGTGRTTGVTVSSATLNITVPAAPTGISLTAQGSESRPRNIAMIWCIKINGSVMTGGLGSMAFQNADNVTITAGNAVFTSLKSNKAPTDPTDVMRLQDAASGVVTSIASYDTDMMTINLSDPAIPSIVPVTNVANGMVKLNSSGLVPPSLLGVSDLSYQGPWDASGGTLPPTGANGDYYIIAVGGTLTLRDTSGDNVSTVVSPSDRIIYLTASTSYPNTGWYYNPVATGSVIASGVAYTPYGTTAATNVQTALNELADEKVHKTSNTKSAILPKGTTAQRDAGPSTGMIRYNTDLAAFEGYAGTSWQTFAVPIDLTDSENTWTYKQTFNAVKEIPGAIYGTPDIAVDPTNGSTQYAGLSGGAVTIDASAITTGHTVTLCIFIDAAVTISWTGVLGWLKVGGGGTPPVLPPTSTNYIILSNIGGNVVGSYAGSV